MQRPQSSTLFPYTTLFRSYFSSASLYAETQGDGRGFSWSNDGNWHHIALVLPSGGSKTSDVLIYLDGVLQPASGGSLTLVRSEEHTSELQSHVNLVCRLLL